MLKLKLPRIDWPWRRKRRLSERTWGIIIVTAIILIVAAVIMTNRPSGPEVPDPDEDSEANVSADVGKNSVVNSVISAPAPKDDACKNPYFPVTKGYRVEFGNVINNKVVPAYRTVIEGQKGQSARQTYEFDGTRVSLDLACSDGNIVPKQYVDLISAFDRQKLEVVTKEVQGELLPKGLAKDKLWKLKYVVSVKTDDAKLLGAGFKDVTYVIEETRKVVSSNETLTSPAGTFDVIRVQVDQVVTAQLPANSPIKVQPVKRTYLAFYGKHAGLLRLTEWGKWDVVASKTGM
jgi:hypothetical protein